MFFAYDVFAFEIITIQSLLEKKIFLISLNGQLYKCIYTIKITKPN